MSEVHGGGPAPAGYCLKCNSGYAVGPHECPADDREGFERWASSRGMDILHPYGPQYQQPTTVAAWAAWCARGDVLEPIRQPHLPKGTPP